MKKILLCGMLCLSLLLCAQAVAKTGKTETRCGWIDNPSPANFWLVDGTGQWTISEQGGYYAKNADVIPDLSGDEFVDGGGPHGYSCGCITGVMDYPEKRFASIVKVKPKKLKECLGDMNLPPPDASFNKAP